MKYSIGHSFINDSFEAVKEVTTGFEKPVLILFFSMQYNFDELTDIFHKLYPDSCIIGATTCHFFFSEMSRGEYKSRGGLTAIAFSDGITCAGGVLENIKRYPGRYKNRIADGLAELGNTENTICLSFTTAFQQAEELVMDTFAMILGEKNIPIIGSTCGMGENETITSVSYNGKVYNEGSVFVLIRNDEGRIHIFKENIFIPTRYKLMATDVDVENRVVYSYNDVPAVMMLSRILHVDTETLPDIWNDFPVGRIGKDGDISATEAAGVVEKDAIAYCARIYNQTKLCIMEIGDYENTVRRMFKKIENTCEKKSVSFLINCMSLYKLFERKEWLKVYKEELDEVLKDYIGISGYGEQINRCHVNKTIAVVVFEDGR